MDEQSLKRLAAINRQLARSNCRVTNFAARLTDRVDALVAASLASDWDEVRRQSEFLATSGQVYGFDEIAMSANDLCQRVDQQAQPVDIKRALMQLIGKCGSARADRDAADSNNATPSSGD